MSILVTGTIDFDPANRDKAIETVTACMEATRAEDGCESYAFSGDLNDPGRFHISEQWASQEAMDSHMQTPHMAALMGAMGSLGVTAASHHEVGRRHPDEAGVGADRRTARTGRRRAGFAGRREALAEGVRSEATPGASVSAGRPRSRSPAAGGRRGPARRRRGRPRSGCRRRR